MFSLYALFFFCMLAQCMYTFEKIKTKLMGIFEYLFIFGILTVTCHNIFAFAEMSSTFGIQFEFHISRIFFFGLVYEYNRPTFIELLILL